MLVKLIADGWFVPMVADRSSYNGDVLKTIKSLFEDVTDEKTMFEVEPRYLNIVVAGPSDSAPYLRVVPEHRHSREQDDYSKCCHE